jgi:glycogen synthase
MRILFVSNYFPPAAKGGYEQWCEEVALALAARGHSMAVLTSSVAMTTSQGGLAAEGGDSTYPFVVHRLLHHQVEGGLAHTSLRLLREPHRFEEENLDHTQRVVDEFRPDAVMIWGMWNIDRSVPQRIEALMGAHVAYYFCDYWPTLPSAYVQRFQEPARHAPMQYVKSLMGRYFLPRLGNVDPAPLRLENPICVSRAVRDILVSRGAAVEHARIVYGGTTVEQFDVVRQPNALSDLIGSEPLRLLYIGRLEPIKGVHTVVAAMQRLDSPVTLSILGAGDPDYAAALQATVVQARMDGRVRFLGAAPRSEVPQVLAQYDVLLFPSEWDEPFARSVLEAMAAGLAVVGTTTGGTGEILIEGETGLTFPAGDAVQLASQIQRLVDDPGLRQRLAQSARQIVRQYYTLGRMVDELEAELQHVASMPAPIPL